jgi:hypothetical protein
MSFGQYLKKNFELVLNLNYAKKKKIFVAFGG